MLRGYIPPYTATVVQKLEAQGAVLLGKTNMDEFALGSSTENSCFGPTLNPHDSTRVAGGTSGGSAAAVAANLAVFALGTDTGGSIRQPAAFCGVVGLKVTYGRVSRYGVVAAASSLDTIGSLALTVEDVALVLEQIAGLDAFDSTTGDQPVEHYSNVTAQAKPFTIGVPEEYIKAAGLDEEIRQNLDQLLKNLAEYNITVKSITLPHTHEAIAAYYIINPAEVSSNLARYDGIKYGYRAHSAEELYDVYTHSRQQGLGAEAKRRIMLGTYVLSAGYYDAYYVKAAQVRTLVKQDFEHAFQEVDVILAPATPTPAFTVGEKATDPIAMYLADIFTVPSSLAGIPGIVVPCGKVGKLPLGVQVLGPQWGEANVLQCAKVIEQLSGMQ
jgi:aspartyl-tRNA(Asn)/glutamyl-tRNA(Gln) amidotransferase subunit A